MCGARPFLSFTSFLPFHSSRRKRSSEVFTIDMVHILPGYPKESTDNPSITLLAFYLKLPKGFSDDIVNNDVLKAIVESEAKSIEKSVGGTIISVQPLIPTTETTEEIKVTGNQISRISLL